MSPEGVISSIEFQMSLLLFVALAGYLLASRINQSAVIGEILVGLIVGPSILGLVTYTDFVSSIAHLGAIILLFVIGFEFNIREIFNVKYSIIAGFGVIIPWIGGYITAVLFHFDMQGAFFVGTALTATSIAITANVLREINQLQSDAAKAIIGAAVIDDVLSLLALAITEDFVSGSFTPEGVVFVFIKAIGFMAIFGLLGVSVISKLLMKLDQSRIAEKFPEFAFITAMMIAFFYAMVADLVGLSGIVGAFLAGVSMESVGLRHSKDLKEGAEYLQIIFASIFFVSLGILVDIHALTVDGIIFMLVLTVVAILTKVVGCAIPSRLIGICNRDSLIVGFGMSPRGEVAMIVALIGLTGGIIGQDIYAGIVFMSLLTTISTPIVYRNWLYRKNPCLSEGTE
ncbi:cation:proton antiporter [Methanospirillum purgamenti]|jgi:Kef-type K+ transport system membrane component KefB|uniref:Cation:proton antiporter n=1 Tax=Methanospirillum hungatei TaxID=2203 RepID=A0A8F5VP22_METHU|nr:cation:proton antiporter [Methanospirillum hungatei]QXO95047.1 cation:proton antiporter [Methanospirillum hungatei]